jgi:hypothetical protein
MLLMGDPSHTIEESNIVQQPQGERADLVPKEESPILRRMDGGVNKAVLVQNLTRRADKIVRV